MPKKEEEQCCHKILYILKTPNINVNIYSIKHKSLENVLASSHSAPPFRNAS